MKESGGKIFGIGLPKTGTSSLHRALSDLGVNSVHYPISDVIPALHQGEYDALPDTCQAFVNCGEWHFPALDRAYPGSRFICTWRDFDEWISSLERHFARYDFPRPVDTAFRNRLEVFGIAVFDRDVMETIYWAHRHAVERYFGNRADLLWLNVADTDAMQKLCEYLDLPPVGNIFPHENKGSR